jgi:hypothetical protein
MRIIKFIPEHAKELVVENKLSFGTQSPDHDWEHHMERAEFLGFKKEGIMKKFGPEGADYIVMGKVK